MQVNITFRHLDPIDSLKNYTAEKVDRAEKYLDKAGDAHVVLSIERHLHAADITIHSGNFVLRGREKSEDMYASIDLAMDKIEKQLRKYKERLKHHHGKERVHHRLDLVQSLKVRHEIIELNEGTDAVKAESPAPRVVRATDFHISKMTVDEAIMQMDLMNNDFFVFTNTTSNDMNVVYRRKDGHYGLIDPNSQQRA